MGDTQQVVLHDTLAGGGPAITTYLEVAQGNYGDDGILLSITNPPRVVVENYAGKLMLQVWATEASVGHDPTHSIEIEIGGE